MIYRFGAYAIDADRLELTASGKPVAVQPQVFALLLLLIENRERVVSKDEIIDQVWDGRIVSDSTLNARINAARRAVGDTGDAQLVVKTFPRRGFRFVAPVEQADSKRKAQAPKIGLASQPSIAVLPFENRSGEPDQEYLSDGIAEDIAAALSRVRWLRVAAFGLTAQYRQTKPDIRQIAANLEVSWILRGSIRRDGERVRIVAELIDGETGQQVWGERYDDQFTGLFNLQDSITSAIVSQVQPELAKAAQDQAYTKPPESLDAWGFFHRGMARMFDRGIRENPDHLSAALEDFEESIALDPDFARPYVGRAFCSYYRTVFGYTDAPAASIEQGLADARRAIELDPLDAQAYVASATMLVMSHRPQDAVRQCRKAIELNPNLSQGYFLLGHATLCAGRTEESIEHLITSIRTGPHDQFTAPAMMYIGMANVILGNYEDAANWARDSLDLPNQSFWSNIVLTSALGHLGNGPEAMLSFEELRKRKPGFTRDFVEKTSTLDVAEDRARLIEGLAKAGVPE